MTVNTHEIPRRAKSILFSRAFFVGIMILVQLIILLLFILRLSRHFYLFYIGLLLLSLVMSVVIINSRANPAYKMAWLIPVLTIPIFGGVMYVMFGRSGMDRGIPSYFSRILSRRDALFSQNEEVIKNLEQKSVQLATEAKYLSLHGYPIYEGSPVSYFSSAEEAFEEMKKAMRSAKRYIFMEYFIIGEGAMWSEIEDILAERAAEGVEIRVIYDGFGCVLTTPSDFIQKLAKRGITARRFMPVLPILTSMHNNRDHRKITVIDGETAFTGGYNIADEYVNYYARFGHWKDSGLLLRGEAAFSLTRIFLNMWEAISGKPQSFEDYIPETFDKSSEGFAAPFASNPFDQPSVAAMSYLNLIHRARRYLYICTPYLVIDDTFLTALSLSAQSGVDVRIMVPGIPDKRYVQIVARAYYPQLLKAGVRIYEYTPGFLHCKSMVSDDNVAIVGTINLDYRSMFLQYECGVWLSQDKVVADVRNDFLRTVGDCREITLDSPIIRPGLRGRVWRELLRLFAPLM